MKKEKKKFVENRNKATKRREEEVPKDSLLILDFLYPSYFISTRITGKKSRKKK